MTVLEKVEAIKLLESLLRKKTFNDDEKKEIKIKLLQIISKI